MTLSNRQRRTFAAVMDALVPPIPGTDGLHAASATDLGLVDRIDELVAWLPHDNDRRDLRRLLWLLSTRLGGWLMYGSGHAFTKLDPAAAEQALRTMVGSRLAIRRQVFRTLKLLTGLALATPPPGRSSTPVWAEMGYPGPDGGPPAVPKPLSPVPVTGPTEWTADAVVVGSGAGGGTAAAVLAAAGLDVVVLEKGPYRNEADFTHLESEAYRDLFLDQGMAATSDLGMGLLAGSNLGGGTTVNWTTSFATPPAVRDDWDRESGLAGVFTGADYEASSQAVHQRLGINYDHSTPSSTDEIMEKGLRGLGWDAAPLPRNVDGCDPDTCGYCTMGCRIGAKRGTLRTYLEDAAAAGARLVVEADVERVVVENGRAVGVTATVDGHRLTVRCRAVVLAAGALSTPLLLLRSGITGAAGRHLRLHPVSAVWGRFPDPVDPWRGMLQTLVSSEFADLDGAGYGFRFETGPVHPLFPTTFYGWDGGRAFKDLVATFRYWSPVGILLRDRGEGSAALRRDGRPLWKYRLSKGDAAHMRVGVQRAAEVLAEAGAEEVLASTARPAIWRPGARGKVKAFLTEIDSVAGFGPNQMAYLSFHQMGSARMGADPAHSVVDGDNQVHGIAGLYVADGSCFPTASGVNPMTSIQTIAHRAATGLAARLA